MLFKKIGLLKILDGKNDCNDEKKILMQLNRKNDCNVCDYWKCITLKNDNT